MKCPKKVADKCPDLLIQDSLLYKQSNQDIAFFSSINKTDVKQNMFPCVFHPSSLKQTIYFPLPPPPTMETTPVPSKIPPGFPYSLEV